MAGATFHITVNLGQTARLQPWATNLPKNAITAMQQSFSQAVNVVRGRERVKTGNMRNNTIYSAQPKGAQIVASAGYSGYQDFGTRYMSGTHFMEAGVDEINKELPTAITRIISTI